MDKKQVIRLTENQFHKIVKECVKNVLNEKIVYDFVTGDLPPSYDNDMPAVVVNKPNEGKFAYHVYLVPTSWGFGRDVYYVFADSEADCLERLVAYLHKSGFDAYFTDSDERYKKMGVEFKYEGLKTGDLGNWGDFYVDATRYGGGRHFINGDGMSIEKIPEEMVRRY